MHLVNNNDFGVEFSSKKMTGEMKCFDAREGAICFVVYTNITTVFDINDYFRITFRVREKTF